MELMVWYLIVQTVRNSDFQCLTVQSVRLYSIPKKDKILLIQQYGHKDNILIAGYVTKGENAKQALFREIKEETGLPVIGLVKIQYPGYEGYITPTMKEVDDLVAAGSDVVALDCTLRKRGDGTTVNEFIAQIKEKYPDIILMADISNYEEGINAWKCGVDIVGTTMSGYTDYTSKKDEPDYELMERLAKDTDIPVIGEGKIHYPDQAVKALQTGAWGNRSRRSNHTSSGNCTALPECDQRKQINWIKNNENSPRIWISDKTEGERITENKTSKGM